MEKQQVALKDTLMAKRMTPGALEAAGGSSRSKRGFKLALALVAAMGLLIVVLVTAFAYWFLQSRVITSCDQPPEAPPASDQVIRINDHGALMTKCPWKESDSEKKYDLFVANYSATYLVYGLVKFSEVTHQQLTLFQSERKEGDSVPVPMTATQSGSETVFYVFEELKMIKDITLSLSVPGNLKSCEYSRFHVSCVRDCFKNVLNDRRDHAGAEINQV